MCVKSPACVHSCVCLSMHPCEMDSQLVEWIYIYETLQTLSLSAYKGLSPKIFSESIIPGGGKWKLNFILKKPKEAMVY